MKCEKCGAEYDDANRFCGMCGTPNPLLERKESQEENTEAVFPDFTNTAEVPVYASDMPNENSENEAGTAPSVISEEDQEDDAENKPDESVFPDPTKPLTPFEPFDAAQTVSDEQIVSEAEAQGSEAEETNDPSDPPEADKNPEAPAPQDSFAETAKVPNNAAYTYAQPNFAPTNHNKEKKRKAPKEKRVCSLSAVVVCIIIILILSVACGALGGLYLGEKNRARKTSGGRIGTVIAPSSYSEIFVKK